MKITIQKGGEVMKKEDPRLTPEARQKRRRLGLDTIVAIAIRIIETEKGVVTTK